MTSPEATRRRPDFRKAWIRLCLVLICGISAPAWSAGEDGPQAWLLTYGPGEIYWQRYGHNAIWIRDPARGLDHTFNFGFFDFAQRGFLRNFVLGRLNYFAAAREAQIELAEYIDDNRSIRAQRLDLGPERVMLLADYLLTQVSPENREYLYDYYRHNCSTRIRDALDLAFDGALNAALEPSQSPLDYRDHTRRLTGMDFWLYLGLQTGLGSPVDQPINRWDETFIPGVLAQAMEELVVPGSGMPAVIEDAMLYESTLPEPPQSPQTLWYRYLGLSVLVLLLSALACRAVPKLAARHLALPWLVLAGLVGCGLAFLWLFTDHWVSSLNLNLLLFNPLWLVIAAAPPLQRPGAWFLVACGLLALAAPWLPPGQYNADVVALALPLNLAAAWCLGRNTHD